MRNQIRNIAWTTLLAALFLSPQDTQGQYALDYGFAFGTATTSGTWGDALERRDFFPDLHLSQTKLSTHVFVRQRLNGAWPFGLSWAPRSSKTTTTCPPTRLE